MARLTVANVAVFIHEYLVHILELSELTQIYIQ